MISYIEASASFGWPKENKKKKQGRQTIYNRVNTIKLFID
jgi:hypothetical protein